MKLKLNYLVFVTVRGEVTGLAVVFVVVADFVTVVHLGSFDVLEVH